MEFEFYGQTKTVKSLPKSFKSFIKKARNAFPIGFIEQCSMEYKTPSNEWMKISRIHDFKRMMKVFKTGEKEVLLIKLTTKGSYTTI